MTQISPGDLSEPHEDLEGITKCTSCHVLGGKVTNELCLECHKTLRSMLQAGRGYHSNAEITTRECASCHSDHHGRNFNMIRFAEDKFDHRLTGFDLTGKHASLECRACHQPDLIAMREFSDKKNTYMGLDSKCISCHEDVHQNTLSSECTQCHNTQSFTPVAGFNHDHAGFALKGKHREVECVRCHEVVTRNGRDFQRFTDLEYGNCTSCHQDVHDNRFGQNCLQCHNETSFGIAGSLENFDHRKTGFDLNGQHRNVDCRQCHKKNYTDPLPHNKCSSCHTDYHKGQFVRKDSSPDCDVCHSVNGFNESSYTIEDHQDGAFRLEGAHLATPCFACHQKSSWWSFRDVGEKCSDCHEDIHDGQIDELFYPGKACENCHIVESWKKNHFDHNITEFALAGAHAGKDCMDCHGPQENGSVHIYGNFRGLSANCEGCHENVHHAQFEENGITDCEKCHGFENWMVVNFDHDQTDFKLDGKHAVTECSACHLEVEQQGRSFVLYKIDRFECIDCHQ